jgi:hypothetical protein
VKADWSGAADGNGLHERLELKARGHYCCVAPSVKLPDNDLPVSAAACGLMLKLSPEGIGFNPPKVRQRSPRTG